MTPRQRPEEATHRRDHRGAGVAPARPKNPVILIPARMASTRLPGKPLADIHGKPMICHVLARAQEAGFRRIVVACAEPEIAAAVAKAGGEAVLTRADHPSGSDRIVEALCRIDPEGAHDAVINLQGDLPTLDPALIGRAFALLDEPATDIGTLAAVITRESEKANPNVVKAVVEMAPDTRRGRALYFSRATVPHGEGPLLHHIGIYVYRRAALETFVSAPPSQLEQREKLEQLRALALGLRIDVAVVDTVPLGVDTPEDLETARAILEKTP